jgi:Zn-finger nucleic acid-binding protein
VHTPTLHVRDKYGLFEKCSKKQGYKKVFGSSSREDLLIAKMKRKMNLHYWVNPVGIGAAIIHFSLTECEATVIPELGLDRGELDKIIEKSTETVKAKPVSGEIPRPVPDPYYSDGYGYQDDHHKHGGRIGYKRKSWLGDLFD